MTAKDEEADPVQQQMLARERAAEKVLATNTRTLKRRRALAKRGDSKPC